MVLRIIAGPHPRWQPYLLGGTVGPNLRHAPSVTAPRFSRYTEPAWARCSYASDTASCRVMIRFDHNSHFRRVLRLTSLQPGSTTIPSAAWTPGHLLGSREGVRG